MLKVAGELANGVHVGILPFSLWPVTAGPGCVRIYRLSDGHRAT
jgi:hypothetical protein